MTIRVEIRKYKMSDADLIQLADSTNSTATRDLAELADYGVDAATLTALMAARTAFYNNPTDGELSADMGIATQEKNDKREELLKAIRQIASRARIKYGEKNDKFRKFGVEMLSRQRDNELARIGKRVSDTATELLSDLESEGLTAEKITEFDIILVDFDDLIDAQGDAKKNRDLAVDTRIRLGNELYEKVVNLAAKGKLCWQDINEAKYNDYIIHPSSGGGTADVVTGPVTGNSTVNLSITGNDSSTIFTLKNTGDADLIFFFADEPTDDSGPSSITVAAHTEQVAAASTLGYDEIAGFVSFNVHNNMPINGAYEVRWE